MTIIMLDSSGEWWFLVTTVIVYKPYCQIGTHMAHNLLGALPSAKTSAFHGSMLLVGIVHKHAVSSRANS